MTQYIQGSKERIFKNAAKICFTILVGLAIFILDLSLALGVAGGVPYVAFVLMGLLYSNKRVTILLGVIALLLTIFGFYLSPVGEQALWKTLLNRFYAIFAIVVLTVFVYFYKKSLKEILLKSEEKFRNIVENTSEWIWELDETGVITYSNSVVEQILGHKSVGK